VTSSLCIVVHSFQAMMDTGRVNGSSRAWRDLDPHHSAFHMPRSVGLFRAQGWSVIPDPVDYQTGTGQEDADFSIDLSRHLDLLSVAIKEWAGLIANRLLGHSESFFPGPAS
jgi:hypothetical protein